MTYILHHCYVWSYVRTVRALRHTKDPSSARGYLRGGGACVIGAISGATTSRRSILWATGARLPHLVYLCEGAASPLIGLRARPHSRREATSKCEIYFCT